MALKATVFKAQLNVADLDRGHYSEHALTVARHPSETDERMMLRILAFALNAHERLAFGKGLSTADEPDLWQHDLTGAIEHWIEVGQPDDKRLLRACGRAAQVTVYGYGNRSEAWWRSTAAALERAENLAVWRIPGDASAELAELAARNMTLQCTVQDACVWMSAADRVVQIAPIALATCDPGATRRP